jgi:hypothetical protein
MKPAGVVAAALLGAALARRASSGPRQFQMPAKDRDAVAPLF